ncbi:hypothetical protein J437_LFUL000546 [Ladona fulva]|uniref:Spaetzle domain-containing protein n=1 Tax=Ladona fulva TaxID=123851 RepID=A0A8K0JWG3_LADFU|nr:hypothetical protein J437_LFUL000546 [Ladona fulva]
MNVVISRETNFQQNNFESQNSRGITVLTLAACVRIPPASAFNNDFDTTFHRHQHHHQSQQIRLRHHNGGSRDRELVVESFFDDREDTSLSDFPETTSRSRDPLLRAPRHSLSESRAVASFRGDTDDRSEWVTEKDLLLSDAAIEEEVEDMASLGFDGGGGRGGHHSHRGGGGKWRKTAREMRREGKGNPIECCPSVTEMIQPVAGKNIEGMFVELYRDGEQQQRFVEISCRRDVEGKPCRFLDRRLHNQSRCVQRTSYSYALVKDDSNGSAAAAAARHPKVDHRLLGSNYSTLPVVNGSGWTLDYIEVRSGCSCEVTPPEVGRRKGRGGGGGSKNKKKGAKKKALD